MKGSLNPRLNAVKASLHRILEETGADPWIHLVLQLGSQQENGLE